MAPEEARRQARLKFGAVEAIREEYHADEGLLLACWPLSSSKTEHPS